MLLPPVSPDLDFIGLTDSDSEGVEVQMPDFKKPSRYVMSDQTLQEFGLKESDIPDQMRQSPINYKNHIGKNVRHAKLTKDLTRAKYLRKI